MLDSSRALSHYLSPVAEVVSALSLSILVSYYPPIFSLSLLFYSVSWLKKPLPRLIFSKLASNKGHFKDKQKHAITLITAFL